MSKLTFPSHPLLLGFDQLERLVERTARSSADGYPPFNIEVTGEHSFPHYPCAGRVRRG